MIQAARFGFRRNPERVVAAIDRDPEWKTDRLTSAILDFGGPHQAIFTCSTQLVPYQRVHFIGTKGRIELEIPVNAPPDKPTRIFIDDGSDLGGGSIKTETFTVCDQYTLQADAFSRAVLEDKEVPVPLEEAIQNMAVIEAVFRSAASNQWEKP
jgi:predicted dehydrogenase